MWVWAVTVNRECGSNMWPQSLSSTSTHLVDDDDDDDDDAAAAAISWVDVQPLLEQVVPNLLVLGCASQVPYGYILHITGWSHLHPNSYPFWLILSLMRPINIIHLFVSSSFFRIFPGFQWFNNEHFPSIWLKPWFTSHFFLVDLEGFHKGGYPKWLVYKGKSHL